MARPPMTAATRTIACRRCSSPPATWRRSWTNSATTRCGRPSTTSSTKAMSASRTWCSSASGLPRRPSGSSSAVRSTCCRCGIRSGSRKTTRWPTSSPTVASSWGLAAAITRARWTFGAPLIDAEKNREYFEEQLQLLLACFNEERFSFKGKYFTCPPEVEYRGYQLKDITMVPRPKHLPVEVWMPVASGKTIEMIAKYGLKAMVTLNGEKILDDVVRAYQAACAQHGVQKKLGEDMVWGTGLYLSGSQEEAIRAVEPAHDERY